MTAEAKAAAYDRAVKLLQGQCEGLARYAISIWQRCGVLDGADRARLGGMLIALYFLTLPPDPLSVDGLLFATGWAMGADEPAAARAA